MDKSFSYIFFILFCLCAFSCNTQEEEAFARAVTFGTVEEIEVFLKSGHSPDYIKYQGAIPWWDTNPLWNVSYNFEKAKLFITYNANVTNRPYIGAELGSQRILSERYPDNSLYEGGVVYLEKDMYKLILLFLEAGANPNAKWGPTRPLLPPTDARYRGYFEENGDSPINSAIRKNLFSIVDLLLEYGAVLDRFSLDRAKTATEKSGSTEMEEYIQKIWEQQNQEFP